MTTPESNGLFWGLKHSENGRNFFHAFLTYTKFTFCKKIGRKRLTQASAVVWRKHCHVYGVTDDRDKEPMMDTKIIWMGN